MTIEQDGADEPVGDAVCWLHELCPACGAMPSPGQPDRCWRCGGPVPGDAGPGDPAEGGPGHGRA